VLRLYEGGSARQRPARCGRISRPGSTRCAHPLVGDARYRGLLGALELVSDKASKRGFDASLGLADRIFATGYRNGLVFRSFGDHILGFAPALTFTEDEFAQMFTRLKTTLDEVLAAPDVRAALAS
jgi:adenosylmethionine-8-amino-7-oxononanoate aminotransferase